MRYWIWVICVFSSPLYSQVRIARTEDNRSMFVETKAVRYAKGRKKVCIVSVAQCGSAAYYKAISALARDYETVLYQGGIVPSKEARRENPTATKKIEDCSEILRKIADMAGLKLAKDVLPKMLPPRARQMIDCDSYLSDLESLKVEFTYEVFGKNIAKYHLDYSSKIERQRELRKLFLKEVITEFTDSHIDRLIFPKTDRYQKFVHRHASLMFERILKEIETSKNVICLVGPAAYLESLIAKKGYRFEYEFAFEAISVHKAGSKPF